jgi:hypothetical protein
VEDLPPHGRGPGAQHGRQLAALVPGGHRGAGAEGEGEQARAQPREWPEARDLAGEQLAVQPDVARLVEQQAAQERARFLVVHPRHHGAVEGAGQDLHVIELDQQDGAARRRRKTFWIQKGAPRAMPRRRRWASSSWAWPSSSRA